MPAKDNWFSEWLFWKFWESVAEIALELLLP